MSVPEVVHGRENKGEAVGFCLAIFDFRIVFLEPHLRVYREGTV